MKARQVIGLILIVVGIVLIPIGVYLVTYTPPIPFPFAGVPHHPNLPPAVYPYTLAGLVLIISGLIMLITGILLLVIKPER